jgi:hypothetical protein
LAKDIRDFLKKMFLDSWGQRMDNIVLHSLYLLICDTRDNGVAHAFKDLHRLLVDEEYRLAIVHRTTRASEAAFWGEGGEFSQQPKNATATILSKIGGLFLSGSLTERIFSATHNDVDIPKLINTAGIGIFNLSRGKLGADVSNFLGQVIVQSFTEAAFARALQNPHDRRLFHLAVDEFQEYATSAFNDVLSQLGKYRLALTMSHQYLDQIPSELRSAIFANVTTMVAFRVAERDAAAMCREMRTVRQFVRIRERGEYWPLEEFVAYIKDRLMDLSIEYLNKPGLMQSQIDSALAAVSSPTINAAALKEIVHKEFGRNDRLKKLYKEIFGYSAYEGERLFPDMEFVEQVWPTVDHLINLPRFTAFIRVDQAYNVRRFHTILAPPPDP